MNHQPIGLTSLVLAAALFSSSVASAATNLVYFTWSNPSGGSATGGAAGITASVSSSIANATLTRRTATATDPGFISLYPSSMPQLNFTATSGGFSFVESTITFSGALPSGARLFAIDVDNGSEQFTLTSGGSGLSFVENRESINGASSSFPGYNATTGLLSGPGGAYNEAASIFDVSGLTTINVRYDYLGAGGGTAGRIGIAIVPEPSRALLSMIALSLVAARRRRS